MLAAKRNTSATMATNSMDHPRGSACTAEFGMAACLHANVGFIVASLGLNNYNSWLSAIILSTKSSQADLLVGEVEASRLTVANL